MLTHLVGAHAPQHPNALTACPLRQLVEQPRLATTGFSLHHQKRRSSQSQVSDLYVELFNLSRATDKRSFSQGAPAIVESNDEIGITVVPIHCIFDRGQIRQ